MRQVLHPLHRPAELGAPRGELPAWPGTRFKLEELAGLGPGVSRAPGGSPQKEKACLIRPYS